MIETPHLKLVKDEVLSGERLDAVREGIDRVLKHAVGEMRERGCDTLSLEMVEMLATTAKDSLQLLAQLALDYEAMLADLREAARGL